MDWRRRSGKTFKEDKTKKDHKSINKTRTIGARSVWQRMKWRNMSRW